MLNKCLSVVLLLCVPIVQAAAPQKKAKDYLPIYKIEFKTQVKDIQSQRPDPHILTERMCGISGSITLAQFQKSIEKNVLKGVEQLTALKGNKRQWIEIDKLEREVAITQLKNMRNWLWKRKNRIITPAAIQTVLKDQWILLEKEGEIHKVPAEAFSLDDQPTEYTQLSPKKKKDKDKIVYVPSWAYLRIGGSVKDITAESTVDLLEEARTQGAIHVGLWSWHTLDLEAYLITAKDIQASSKPLKYRVVPPDPTHNPVDIEKEETNSADNTPSPEPLIREATNPVNYKGLGGYKPLSHPIDKKVKRESQKPPTFRYGYIVATPACLVVGYVCLKKVKRRRALPGFE